jgi:hypothetical protein
MFAHAYDVPNVADASDPANLPALVVQQRRFLAIKEAQARVCQDNMDVDDLRYMGTASVVRDMDFMTTALDGADAKMWVRGGCPTPFANECAAITGAHLMGPF